MQMRFCKDISAYNINCSGVLVYTGLPVDSDDLAYEHHNTCSWEDELLNGQPVTHISPFHYEVYGASMHGLCHGGTEAKKFKVF